MPKKKATSNGKKTKLKEKEPTQEKDPEWEHLEERFNSLNSDFSKLADLMDKE